MKVNNSVKLELSNEELNAVQIVFNMLYNIETPEEKAIDDCICGASLEDVRTTLAEIWELSGCDIDKL
jgi:hypothetical protein